MHLIATVLLAFANQSDLEAEKSFQSDTSSAVESLKGQEKAIVKSIRTRLAAGSYDIAKISQLEFTMIKRNIGVVLGPELHRLILASVRDDKNLDANYFDKAGIKDDKVRDRLRVRFFFLNAVEKSDVLKISEAIKSTGREKAIERFGPLFERHSAMFPTP